MSESIDSKRGDEEDNKDSYVPKNRKESILQDEHYISNRLRKSIEELSTKSSENQKKYKKIKRIEIVAAAMIPLLVTLTHVPSLEKYFDMPFTILAGLGGVMLALTNNILRMGGYYSKWKEYRSKAEALKREEYLYRVALPPYESGDAFPRIVEKVEKILNETDQDTPQNG